MIYIYSIIYKENKEIDPKTINPKVGFMKDFRNLWFLAVKCLESINPSKILLKSKLVSGVVRLLLDPFVGSASVAERIRLPQHFGVVRPVHRPEDFPRQGLASARAGARLAVMPALCHGQRDHLQTCAEVHDENSTWSRPQRFLKSSSLPLSK